MEEIASACSGGSGKPWGVRLWPRSCISYLISSGHAVWVFPQTLISAAVRLQDSLTLIAFRPEPTSTGANRWGIYSQAPFPPAPGYFHHVIHCRLLQISSSDISVVVYVKGKCPLRESACWRNAGMLCVQRSNSGKEANLRNPKKN